MQPDLLSPQQKEKQPGSLDLQEITQPHLSLVTEATQLESVSALEPTSHQATPVMEKKRPKLNVAAIILGIFAFMLLVAVAGLGYWGYILRTELIATQQQLTKLQGEQTNLQTNYATLKSEKEKLEADLTQSKADLEKANIELATTQADLKKSQDQNKNLNTQITKAQKLAEVLYASTFSDDPSDAFKIDSLVKKVNEQQLITQWDDFTKSPNKDTFDKFFTFLVADIRETLK